MTVIGWYSYSYQAGMMGQGQGVTILLQLDAGKYSELDLIDNLIPYYRLETRV